MIVYVESNFVLELALGQEESVTAESILILAEQGDIEIVFSSFAISEPFATVTHRERERLRLSNSLKEMLRQLNRSEPHQRVVSDLQFVPAVLADIGKKEADLLQSTVKRLLNIGRSLEINGAGFEQAIVYQLLFNLSAQDSIIYAAVIADLRRKARNELKCFISRDKKAFIDPSIGYELTSFNCNYAESFEEGLNYIQKSIMK